MINFFVNLRGVKRQLPFNMRLELTWSPYIADIGDGWLSTLQYTLNKFASMQLNRAVNSIDAREIVKKDSDDRQPFPRLRKRNKLTCILSL